MHSGEHLRAARTRLRLTQEQVAADLGVTLRSIGNWGRQGVPANSDALVKEWISKHSEGRAKGSVLEEVSDAQLLAEIARRFDRHKEGGERDGNAAPTKTPDGADNVTTMPERRLPQMKKSAARTRSRSPRPLSED